jgi:hypothetical protein
MCEEAQYFSLGDMLIEFSKFEVERHGLPVLSYIIWNYIKSFFPFHVYETPFVIENLITITNSEEKTLETLEILDHPSWISEQKSQTYGSPEDFPVFVPEPSVIPEDEFYSDYDYDEYDDSDNDNYAESYNDDWWRYD